MIRKTFFLLIQLFVFNFSNAQSKEERLIRNVLDEQLSAWNEGNIDGYMQGYWQSDSLMFIGQSGVTYGWKNTLNTYKKAYPDTASTGKLELGIIEIKRLSVMYFHVTGKWSLARTQGNISGYFTLLFKKIKGRWVIIADHSS